VHSAVSEEEELNCLPGRREDDPLFRYLDAEMRQRLTEAINDLPERERLIMTLYYYEETTMTEIGIILGIVESRISQIHASAVLHLRARLSAPATTRRSTTTHQGTKHLRTDFALCIPLIQPAWSYDQQS
jgi:RNA polymerase sigma factor for flagellar operon FliA